METYLYVDSVVNSTGVSNAYVCRLKNRLVGVHKAELLSAAFPALSSCNHVVQDIVEFKTPRNDGNFGFINNLVSINSNIAYTSSSFYPIESKFENPFDIDGTTGHVSQLLASHAPFISVIFL